MAIILCSVASAMAQVTVQQPLGTYTNNSIPVRDGTGNKVKNVSNLIFDSTGALLTVGNNTDEGYYKAIGLNTTASGYLFELKNGGGAVTQQANFFLTDDTPFGLYLNVGSSPETVFQADTTTGAVDFPNPVSLQEQLTSTVTTGTAPFVVASTTLVANLHAATADAATAVTNVGITNDTTTNATMFPLWVTANTGNLPAKVTSTKFTFNPSTGTASSTNFAGTFNGNTFTAGTGILTIGASKTLTVNNSIALTGTDSTVMTFPTTTATIARTDAGQTFTGVQAMTSPAITTSITTPSTTIAVFNTTATTANVLGAATTINIGNASGTTNLLGTLNLNPAGSVAGVAWSGEGTAPSLVANSWGWYSPTDAPAGGAAYVPPSTAGTGFMLATNTAGVHAVTHIAGTGSSNVMRSTSPTLDAGAMTLAENASIALDPAGSADGKYSGITMTGTAGYTQAFGDLVYLDPTDSRWEAADANSASGADGDSRGMLGMVVSAGTDGTACTILLQGIIRADAKFPTFTINNPIYVSETAGSATQTQPTTTDVVIRIIGAAITADEMYFAPDRAWITHT